MWEARSKSWLRDYNDQLCVYVCMHGFCWLWALLLLCGLIAFSCEIPQEKFYRNQIARSRWPVHITSTWECSCPLITCDMNCMTRISVCLQSCVFGIQMIQCRIIVLVTDSVGLTYIVIIAIWTKNVFSPKFLMKSNGCFRR